MNAFNHIAALENAIKSAEGRCKTFEHLRGTIEQAGMQRVVLADYESALVISGFGKFPETSVMRAHYSLNFLAEFLYDREYLGQEGKGTYGIALYRQCRSSLMCSSVLFSDVDHKLLLIQGREAAKKIVAEEVLLRDMCAATKNADIICERGYIAEPVLNAILAELMRAKPKATPATICAHPDGIRLLLDDADESSGRSLWVPEGGFECRDAAAGMLLQEIAYAADDARRAKPAPLAPFFRLAPC